MARDSVRLPPPDPELVLNAWATAAERVSAIAVLLKAMSPRYEGSSLSYLPKTAVVDQVIELMPPSGAGGGVKEAG